MSNEQEEKVAELLDAHNKQLNQTGVVVTDLVVRLTAMERILISSGLIKQEEFDKELKKVTLELTNLIKEFFANSSQPNEKN